MKKYLLYVCVCILLFSCKKQPQSNNLIGKWESYRIEIYNYEHAPSKPIMINEDTRAIYIFDIDGKYDDGGQSFISSSIADGAGGKRGIASAS